MVPKQTQLGELGVFTNCNGKLSKGSSGLDTSTFYTIRQVSLEHQETSKETPLGTRFNDLWAGSV